MKIWVLNNTKFGYKNNSKEWIDIMFHFFESFFIPTIQKYAKPDDIILHMGNIFSTSETIHIHTLLKVKALFNQIGQICPMVLLKGNNEKDYGDGSIIDIFLGDKIKNSDPRIQFNPINLNQEIIFLNSGIDVPLLKNYKGSKFFCGSTDDKLVDENVIFIGSPYELESTDVEKGFYVIDTNGSYKFFKNNISPSFKTLKISDIKQIEEIDPNWVKNNFVSVIIDQDLVNEKKIKIDVLLSKFDFKSVTYTKVEEEQVIEESETLDVEYLVKEKINSSQNPKLIEEFNNILKIYKERY